MASSDITDVLERVDAVSLSSDVESVREQLVWTDRYFEGILPSIAQYLKEQWAKAVDDNLMEGTLLEHPAIRDAVVWVYPDWNIYQSPIVESIKFEILDIDDQYDDIDIPEFARSCPLVDILTGKMTAAIIMDKNVILGSRRYYGVFIESSVIAQYDDLCRDDESVVVLPLIVTAGFTLDIESYWYNIIYNTNGSKMIGGSSAITEINKELVNYLKELDILEYDQ